MTLHSAACVVVVAVVAATIIGGCVLTLAKERMDGLSSVEELTWD